MMLSICKVTLSDVIRHCKGQFPNEACGFLTGEGMRVTGMVPIRNISSEPEHAYMMDVVEVIQDEFYRSSLAGADQRVATFHSHPHTDAMPSSFDVAAAEEGAVYVIVSRLDVRAWRLAPYVVEIDVQSCMDDPAMASSCHDHRHRHPVSVGLDYRDVRGPVRGLRGLYGGPMGVEAGSSEGG